VLVDTETLFFETTREAFARLGLNLTEEAWGLQYLAEGKPSRHIALAMGADPARLEAVIRQRNEQYRRLLGRPPAIRPMVRETLAGLFGRFRMAIVTGCDRDQFDHVHATSGLLEFFELIVTSDDCPHPKPHPELYLTALRALKVQASQCIALEDSPRGLAAARGAGIRCIAIPTELTASLPFPGALAVEANVSAVFKYLPNATLSENGCMPKLP
jgi:HAD superfamily hydrolase (TIGR01509 family)